MRRAALWILAVFLAACSGDSSLAPVVPTARQPIVFLHGIGGSARDWELPIARFKADGWVDRELVTASYSSAISNAEIADEIRRRVDSVRLATASEKVDIIAFSMGSVSSRYYLKNLGGDTRVDAWVSVAGPNHGTETASSCSVIPCIEIRRGSAFLAELNSGDETPGAARYATWWSPCDQVIVPNESAILLGAQNTQTECLPHTGMFTETIYQQVRAFIAP